MKLQVLGCSAVELPKLNLPSFLVDDRILLDAGTIGSFLDEKRQWKIRHVLITHAHLDHIKDLPFFADNILSNKKRFHVTVISVPEVVRALRQYIFNDTVWPDFTRIPTTDNPIIRFRNIKTEKAFTIDGYTITAHEVSHAVPAVGYLIEDKKGKRLLYTGDSGPTDTIWDSLSQTRIHALITEVSFPNRLRKVALRTGHLTPGLLNEEMKKTKTIPDNILITHFKPLYSKSIREELRKLPCSKIRILKDGETFRL
jgi:ribonuclease BN (tRNA processing enzyme)